jgi:hypothetical protein
VQWKRLAILVVTVFVILSVSLTWIAWRRACRPLTPSQILINPSIRNPR